MKKLFIISLFAIIAQYSLSQNTQFGFEIYGGLSNYMDKYTELADHKFKMSYGGTLLVDFKLKEKMYLQSGLGYINNGNAFEFNDAHDVYGEPMDFESKGSTTQNYIIVPLNLRFTNLGKFKKLEIVAGLYYAYMLSSVERSKGYIDEGELIRWDTKRNQTKELENLNRHDLGLNAELHRKIATLGKLNINLGLYGKLGFLPTQKNNDYGYSNYSFGLKTIVRLKSE